MELNKGHIAFAVACFVCGAIIGAGLRSCSSGKTQEPDKPVVIHDTVQIQDSAWLAEHTKPKYVTRHDTLWLPRPEIHRDSANAVGDSNVSDSIPVEIPIMSYQYRDTFVTDTSRIELGVCFSGWNAQIDGIDLKSQYTIQPRTIIKKKGWGQFIGIGIGVGYGASVVGQTVYAAPEVGIHITYGWGYHW